VLNNRSIPSATVIPVLVYPDVRAAVAWLDDAFGFVERVRIGEAHRSQLQVGDDGAVIVADVRGEQQPPRAGAVTHVIKVRVEDVDASARWRTPPATAGSSRRRCATSLPKSGADVRSTRSTWGIVSGAGVG
jgi:hypothetical protein